MTEPYVGQVLPFGFNFAPRNWAQCQGQIFSISQNTALFSILGTSYGGNGQSTFGLPNLQGSVPVGMGQGTGLSDYVVGETGGESSVTLVSGQMPLHSHPLVATSTVGTSLGATDNQLAMGTAGGGKGGGGGYQARIYSTNLANATTGLAPQAISIVGQSLRHNNMQPYLAVNFCIALTGVYPPRS